MTKKPIEGYEGKYEITSTGRVFSLTRKNSKGELRTGKELSPDTSSHGYPRVRLFNGNCPIRVSVHRLVASAFIPNPKNLPMVNHIDGNKDNNSVNNLEWCTASENIQHSWDNNLSKANKSNEGKFGAQSHNHRGILQYDMNDNFIKEYPSMVDASRATGASQSKLSAVCRGKRNSTAGYKWKYTS